MLVRHLTQRAATPGVLQSNHVGAVTHALRRLDALSIDNAPLVATVAELTVDADARSVANVLHNLALSAREQRTPHCALPKVLQEGLHQIQSSLADVVDDLTAPESVMAVEALLMLQPYGASVVQPAVLGELQARALALAHVVERPVELLGILRVALESVSQSRASHRSGVEVDKHTRHRGPQTEGRVVDKARDTDRTVEETESAGRVAKLHAAEEALQQVLSAVDAKLGSWSRQELLTLMDVVTLAPPVAPAPSTSHGGAHRSASAAHCLGGGGVEKSIDAATTAPSQPQPQPPPTLSSPRVVGGLSTGTTPHIIDAARPLVRRILDRTDAMVEHLSPSQCAAWLVRLVRLGLVDSHPLLRRLVHRLDAQGPTRHPPSPDMIAVMSPSQVATCATCLSTILMEQQHRPQVRGADPSSTLVSPSPSALTLTDLDACLRLFFRCFHRLAESAAAPEAHAPRVDLLSLLRDGLPEVSVVDYARRHLPSGALGPSREGSVRARPQSRHGPGGEADIVLASFSRTLERASSLLLRHSAQELSPLAFTRLGCTILHWHVYGCGGAGRDPVGGSGWQVVRRYRSLSDASASQRKLRAFSGLVQQRLPTLSTMDVLQLVNECATALHEEQSAADVGSDRSGSEGEYGGDGADTVRQLESLARTLHLEFQQRLRAGGLVEAAAQLQQQRDRRQRRGLRSGGHADSQQERSSNDRCEGQAPPLSVEELSTAHLCRYMATLSQLHIHTPADYYTTLHMVEGRPLTTRELTTVLTVVARHHLKAPYFLQGCVRRLPELGDTLTPALKARLLKTLGQANGRRFVRAPAFGPLEAGVFFKSPAELEELSYLEVVFAFNGLMDLRQYESGTLRWLVEGPLNHRQPRSVPGQGGNGEDGGAGRRTPSTPLTRSMDFIRSSTTLCEFVVSLCRLGVPAWLTGSGPGATRRSSTAAGLTNAASMNAAASPTTASLNELESLLVLTRDAMRAAAHAVSAPTARSLFTDVSQLTSAWPVLALYPRLFREAADAVEAAAAAAVPDSLTTPDEKPPAPRERALAAVELEWARLCGCVQEVLRARIVDIARSPSLRPNTFLYSQLAGAVCYHVLPAPALPSSPFAPSPGDHAAVGALTLADEERLYANLDLRRIPKILGNTHHVVDATIVAVHIAWRAAEQQRPQWVAIAETILAFTRRSLLSLGSQDLLSVWWVIDTFALSPQRALRRCPVPPVSAENERCRTGAAPASGSAPPPRGELALPASVLRLATEMDEVARIQMRPEGSHTVKLSPTERMVRDLLL